MVLSRILGDSVGLIFYVCCQIAVPQTLSRNVLNILDRKFVTFYNQSRSFRKVRVSFVFRLLSYRQIKTTGKIIIYSRHGHNLTKSNARNHNSNFQNLHLSEAVYIYLNFIYFVFCFVNLSFSQSLILQLNDSGC